MIDELDGIILDECESDYDKLLILAISAMLPRNKLKTRFFLKCTRVAKYFGKTKTQFIGDLERTCFLLCRGIID